jgi:alpha-amylase
MTAICFYFQVHQPYRLKPDFDFFAIGQGRSYEDKVKNAEILRKVAERCYLPANKLILELIKKHEGRFRVSYSISGVALEQFAAYDPRVLESFKELAATGCVEFIGETYYHSLAFLFSRPEFERQVALHREALKRLLGVTATTFRNTELIYNNDIARAAERLGFRTILAEGADRVIGWRSPTYVYTPQGTSKINLLLKHYRLSDDIAFRFSSREWSAWPLTADKFTHWLDSASHHGPAINLFMDYETFGEHQWAETGIFDFLAHLPEKALSRGFQFQTPAEVSAAYRPVATLDVPDYVSWADTERDTTAWLGNHMQNAATKACYALEQPLLATRDPALLHAWGKLQTSDHFYYMCTKFWADGDVHKYFSPYVSPYDAFVYYCNALNELRWRLGAPARLSQAQAHAQQAVASH